MDLDQLRELIECPVCLESMQTNSRVLPCQHFFCSDCLRKIARTEKELRCPECRAVCATPVEELPTSILLMRILEGMKKAGHRLPTPKKEPKKKRTPLAKAVYKYDSGLPSDLVLNKGDYITVKKRIDENWLYGELNGKSGCFPVAFVRVLVPLPADRPEERPTCKALYDFNQSGERDCLCFKKGEVITFIRMVDTNWVEGKLREKIGIFPRVYVSMNDRAKADADLFLAEQASLQASIRSGSRADGPSGSSSNGSSVRGGGGHRGAAGPSGAQGQGQHEIRGASGSIVKRHSVAGVSLNSTSCPLSTSSGSSTNPQRHSMEITTSQRTVPPFPRHSHVSPTSPTHQTLADMFLGDDSFPGPTPARSSSSETFPTPLVPPKSSPSNLPEHGRLKTAVSATGPQKGPVDNKPTLITASETGGLLSAGPKPIYVAEHHYQPKASDELPLVKGQFYRVMDRCHDGWHRGMCLATGCIGVFPGNYVKMVTGTKQQAPGRLDAGEGNVRNIRATGPSVKLLGRTDISTEHLTEEQKKQLSESGRVGPLKPWPTTIVGQVKGNHVRSESLPGDCPPSSAPKLPPKPANHHRRSNSIDTDADHPVPLPISQGTQQHNYQKERYKCVTSYQSRGKAELDLSIGDTVFVQHKGKGGWYTGTQPRTGKSGLFPGCCVERI